MSPSVVDIKVTDANNTRWEIPHEYPFPSFTYGPYSSAVDSLINVTVNWEPFSFQVIRKATGEMIFNTESYNFIFSDKYIEVTTTLPTANIYGIGERVYNFTLGPTGIYTIWNHDLPDYIENNQGNANLYGSHPVYLIREQSFNYSMVYLRNSNGMDMVVNNSEILTYRIVGGLLDLNFFLGDSYPETAVQMYHDYLGGWILHPLWSYGFHQCRWGYVDINNLTWVVGNYTFYDLPLDVIWSDINYMDSYIDFTIDTVNFPLANLSNLLTTSGKRWICIIDAGIALAQNTTIYQNGLAENAYVLDAEGNFLLGDVWPGYVHFPDFFNPNTSSWWQSGLTQLKGLANFSGIWLDMNEVSEFYPCYGECNWTDYCNGTYDNQPYEIGNNNLSMVDQTIRMDSVHYGNLTEYNVHNYFGFFEAKATHDYLLTQSNLSFILTRSTAPGSGQFAAHWTGDNGVTWEFMQMSIAGCMTWNIFGIPMVGADICGFSGGATTPELCARWMQLGTLYTFSRNHHQDDDSWQEPYNLGPTVLETSRIALQLRYSLIKYYYMWFVERQGRGTIFRPVFFEFPQDINLLNTTMPYTDTQFLIGTNLMSAPVLIEGNNYSMPYFPQARWYDFFSGVMLQDRNDTPQVLNYSAPMNSTVPLFLRAGPSGIIHTQDVEGVLSTADLSSQFNLIVGLLPTNGQGDMYATGKIMSLNNFTDANIVQKCKLNNCLLDIYADVYVNGPSIKSSVTFTAEQPLNQLEPIVVSNVQLYGILHPALAGATIMHNGKVLETASVGAHPTKKCAVVYLGVEVRHGDIITIEKISESLIVE
jgi:alpha-glucosidase (family GH31 glycosyl hydrolase)